MKTKIEIENGITLMGVRNLFHAPAPQFSVRPAPELPERVKAKATGEKYRSYEVTHHADKTILTA